MSKSLALLALLFTGGVQAIISPPLNWVWLHPIAWVPAFLVFDQLRGKKAFFAGWLVGFSANLTIFYWLVHTLQEFTNLPPAMGVLALLVFAAGSGLYVGIFALGLDRIKKVAGSWSPIAISLWFVACEFLNPQLFPYYQGVAWYQVSSIFQLVSLTGVSGITLMVILINACLAEQIKKWRGAPTAMTFKTGWAMVIGLLALALIWSANRERLISKAEKEADPLKIALIQSNNDIERRTALQKKGANQVALDLVALSEEAMAKDAKVDVIVWPETALMDRPTARENQSVIEFAKRHEVEVWTGGYGVENSGKEETVFNSAYRVKSDGSLDRRYDKMVRVPFGEYIPFSDTLTFLQRFENPDHVKVGSGVHLYETPAARLSFLICYEAIHPSFVRRSVEQKPNLLVNLTYDGWYGDTSEPSQHLMLTAIQSALFGVPTVRCTTTGVSTVIDARGALGPQTQLNERTAMIAEVRPVQVWTPYTTLGDWLAWGAILFSAFVLWRSRSRVSEG